MTIRIEHQPSGMVVGMASYLAGAGKARERKRRLQPQRLKYQAALGQRRLPQRAGDDIVGGGKWLDPAAGMTPREQATLNAQRTANARRRRLGKDLKYPGAEPVWQRGQTRDERDREQEEKDRDLANQRKIKAAALANQQKVKAVALASGQGVEATAAAQQHARDMATEDALDAGTKVLSPRAKGLIQKEWDTLAEAERSGQHDEEQLVDLREDTAERVRKLRLTGAQLPDTSEMERASRGMAVYDKALGRLRPVRPGEDPTHTIVNDVAQPIEAEETPQEREMVRLKAKADIAGWRAKHDTLEKDTSGKEEYPDPYDELEMMGQNEMLKGLPVGTVDNGDGTVTYKGQIYERDQSR